MFVEQLQEILKFGVDKLLNDEAEEEEVDFTHILGPTVDGEWQTEEAAKQEEEEEEKEEEMVSPQIKILFYLCGEVVICVVLFCF